MQNSYYRQAAILHLCVALILTWVVYWDVAVLKVADWPFYYPFKASVLLMFYGASWLMYKRKADITLVYDFTAFFFYIYCFIGTYYLHPTYIFAFYEGLAMYCIIYVGKSWRFLAHTFWGLTLATLSVNAIPEPDFVREGFSIKPHVQVVTVIFGIMSVIVYFVFNKQRQKLNLLLERFAFIGQQAAFLLHELKSPLARFLSKNSEAENKDGEYIYSIIEGVELIVSKQGPKLLEFEWKDIATYLHEEFDEICRQYDITLELVGLEGRAHGHKSTLRLALKNLVKNAVESIALSKKSGVIRVKRDGSVIEVSNDGPLIDSQKKAQIFQPFYSEKTGNQNFGIGLHFVQSVVNAHKGQIEVDVSDSLNVFRIRLGEIV